MHQVGSYMQSRHIGKAVDLYISSNRWWCPKFRAHTIVSMTSCANVELESELPRLSASCYSKSRAHMTSTATVCVSCMQAPPRLALVGFSSIWATTAIPMILQSLRPSILYTQRFLTALSCRICAEKETKLEIKSQRDRPNAHPSYPLAYKGNHHCV